MIYLFYNILKKVLSIKSLSYFKTNIFYIIVKYFNIFFFEIIKIRNVENLFIKNFIKNYIFISHIDVVDANKKLWKKNPFKFNIFKKKIINRGIVDMKGSLVCFLFANKLFNIVITNDEEKMSIYGIQYFVYILKIRKKKFLLYLGGEPTSTNLVGDTIKLARRGSINVKIILFGIEKHIAYIGKNIILILINRIKKMIKLYNNNEYYEISNLLSSTFNNNLISKFVLFNLNFRFYNFLNIISLKNKIIKYFKNENFYLKWCITGIPFICYKNYYLKKILNIVYKIQNVKTKINFLGGTSDIRYCYYLNKKSFFLEIGLLNKTIHKINENSFFDDCVILLYIYIYINVGLNRFELLTLPLSEVCSNQLSYNPYF